MGILRKRILIEMCDTYEENIIYTNDSGDPLTDYQRDKLRLSPKVPAIGGQAEKSTTSNPNIWGYTNKEPDYLEVPNSSTETNGVFIGADNTAHNGLYVKHTGFHWNDSAPNKQGEATLANHFVTLRRESVQGGGGLDSVYTTVCNIRTGQFAYLDSDGALGNNLAWNIKGYVAGQDPVCIEFFIMGTTG